MEFWNLTFADYNRICKGHFLKQEHKWEHTRFIATCIINASAGKKSGMVTPEKLVPLSFDKKRDVELMSEEKFNYILKRWQVKRQ